MKKANAAQMGPRVCTFAGSSKAAHKVWSGSLNFGLISIPICLMTAATEERVSFNQLHEKCKGRIKQQLFCPQCSSVVERTNLLRGFEYEKDQYIIITDKELDSAEPKSAKTLELSSFVPASQLDPIFFESSYYLTPLEGGEKPYALVREAMLQSDLVGVARIVRSGKEHICIIRPYGPGMILHNLYWINEVRVMGVPTLPTTSDAEIAMAKQLIEMMRNDWDPTAFTDAYRESVLQLIATKREGKEVPTTPVAEAKASNVVDIAVALQQSLEKARAQKGVA